MTTWFSLKGVSVLVVLASALGPASACSSGGSGGTGASGGTGNTAGTGSMLPADSGFCESTCPKDCTADNDCQTSSGELCCDLGVGKTCLPASSCPRFCTDDTKCNTSSGEACLRVDLAVPQKVCTTPANAIQLCQSDSQCKSGDICCTNYNEPACLPPSECPHSCAASSECNTSSGEVCCTTVGKIDASLKVGGLCLNPQYEPCPQACTQSSDCSGAGGALCCDGVCSDTCPKQCKASSECTDPSAPRCCKSAVARLPVGGHIFTTGPTCAGTVYTSCSNCTSSSCCSSIPGCTAGAATGACSGLSFCDDNFTASACATAAGCVWDTSLSKCTGNASPCSTLTSLNTCDLDLGCYWSSGTSTCTGTPTYKSCTGLSSSVCSSVLGCSLQLNPTPAN